MCVAMKNNCRIDNRQPKKEIKAEKHKNKTTMPVWKMSENAIMMMVVV
jgi:hypothetical protein